MSENNEEAVKKEQPEEKKSFSERLKDYIKNLFDFSSFDTKTILFIILFVVLIAVSLYMLYYIYFVDETFLYSIVIEWFVNPIYLLGFIGIFLFIGIMAVQGLLVPIPSEIVLLSAGMIWGVWIGGIMGIIGSMAAGILCFYISRKGGRPLAEKFVGESVLETMDDFIEKYGMGAIVIARFLPFVAFDPISYASGLVDMDVKQYSIATFIGSIPRAFFYSFLGASLGIVPPVDIKALDPDQFRIQAEFFNRLLLIILVFLAIGFIAYYLLMKRAEKKRRTTK